MVQCLIELKSGLMAQGRYTDGVDDLLIRFSSLKKKKSKSTVYVEEINSLLVKRRVSVSGILRKLGISCSGYNTWKNRIPSDTEVRRAVLKEKIKKIYDDSKITVHLKL